MWRLTILSSAALNSINTMLTMAAARRTCSMVEVTVAEVLATGSCCCCLVAVLRPLAVEADCEAMMRGGECEKKKKNKWRTGRGGG